jgi:hypothetical protein
MILVRTSAALCLLCLSVLLATSQQKSTASSPALQSAQRKIQHIESNAGVRTPDSKPTVLTQDEVNAYINSGAVQLPKGVQRIRLEGLPGIVTGNTRVDFDQITQGSRSMNPLLMLFSGVHDVQIATHAHGDRGQGYVHVDRVAIDDVEVPQVALQFFIDHYIKPKHPEVGIDTRFQMPDRVYTAVVGQQQLTIVQK